MAAKLSAANSLVALSRRFRDTGEEGASAGRVGGPLAARPLQTGASLAWSNLSESQEDPDGNGTDTGTDGADGAGGAPPASSSWSLVAVKGAVNGATGVAGSDSHRGLAARKTLEQSRGMVSRSWSGSETGEGHGRAGGGALEAPQSDSTTRVATEAAKLALVCKPALLPILTDAGPERGSSDHVRRAGRSSPARPAAAAASDAVAAAGSTSGPSSSGAGPSSSRALAPAGAELLAIPPSSPAAGTCITASRTPRRQLPQPLLPCCLVASHAQCPRAACLPPATSPSTGPAGTGKSPGRASATREAGGRGLRRWR